MTIGGYGMSRAIVEITDRPCLTEAATLLRETLTRGVEVFEFGSGGSTLWMAAFASRLESVEDDKTYHANVTESMLNRGYSGVKVRLVPTKRLPDAVEGTGMWDVVFVDCLTQNERRRSIILGARHVKPGGWLVADDYNFPLTHKAVEGLRAAGWDVGVVSGIKLHPIRHVPVKTSAAFCHKPK